MTAKAPPREIKLSYEPLPKQIEFHTHPAKYRFFGGGWGNGKTSGGCVEALAMALEYPGSVGLICRKTRPELKATTQDTFFNGGRGGMPGDFTGCPQVLIRKWNKSEQKLTLINDSVIHFWPLDEPQKLSNINLGWYLIDQGEEVPEEMFQMLEGRLRQMNAPRKGIILFNPNGHDWIWRRCVHLKYPQHGLIHATTLDNPNLPPDYIDSLMKMPEAWRKRYIMGSFEVFSGQIWPDFDPNTHTVNPFVVPEWYEIIECIDHGRRNPTAVLWLAFDDKGNCFVIDEHYEAGQLVGHHAGVINEKRMTWGTPNYTVIDASAAQQDPNTGRSVVDEYWDHGIVTVPSDRHVIARINRVAEWLRPDPDWPHPFTGETRGEGWPRLYFFKSCPNIIEHVPQYQWKKQPPNREEDAPEKPLEKDDHDVDALGYGLMTRQPPAKKPTNQQGPNARYWELIQQRLARGGAHAGKAHSMLGSEG